MSQGLYLSEPNNLFTLQNNVTNQMNVFEETKNRYLRCNDPNTSSQVNPACSNKDVFSEVTIAYDNLKTSIDSLDGAMNANGQQNTDAISETGFNDNITQINTKYTNLKDIREKLDKQLVELQNHMSPQNEPDLQLRSTQFIYLLSVIAVFCLIYYIITL
jgi:chromosome segregation ATPase